MGWRGVLHERWPSPAAEERQSRHAGRDAARAVLVVVGGIAGLAARAPQLTRRHRRPARVLELEDQAGGNSRAIIAGMGWLPAGRALPARSPGRRRRTRWRSGWTSWPAPAKSPQGRVVYDERHLCHSPQERLFIDGQWVEACCRRSALPAAERESRWRSTAASRAVQRWVDADAFRMPTARVRPGRAQLAALDAALRRLGWRAKAWTRRRCAGTSTTAAATTMAPAARRCRPGPGCTISPAATASTRRAGEAEREGVLTWPEGNGWLSAKLAAPLGERLHTAASRCACANCARASSSTWNERERRIERWRAAQAVLALPLFVPRAWSNKRPPRSPRLRPRSATRHGWLPTCTASARPSTAAARRLVGQRALPQPRARLCRRCTRACARIPGRPCSPPTGRWRRRCGAGRRRAASCWMAMPQAGPSVCWLTSHAPTRPAAPRAPHRPDALRPRHEHPRAGLRGTRRCRPGADRSAASTSRMPTRGRLSVFEEALPRQPPRPTCSRPSAAHEAFDLARVDRHVAADQSQPVAVITASSPMRMPMFRSVRHAPAGRT